MNTGASDGTVQQQLSPRADRLLGPGRALSFEIRPDVLGAPELVVHGCTDSAVLADGRIAVAVLGPGEGNLDRLVRWLDRGAPDPSPVRQGFVVILWDPRSGVLQCATSMRQEVSLCYAIEPSARGRRFIGSTSLKAVVERMYPLPPLNTAKLANLVALYDDPNTTVFQGVQRLARGRILRWNMTDRPVWRWWFAPETPSRAERERLGRHDAELMRAAVRGAVEASIPATGDVASMLSGGLDSTMVTATAADLLAGHGRTVHAATHVPLPGTPRPIWYLEASDQTFAEHFVAEVAGTSLTLFANTALTDPTVAAAWVYETAYLPPFNPNNNVWSRDIYRWAAGKGSSVLLSGNRGNAVYSRSHYGVLNELIYSGQLSESLRVASGRSTATRRSALRTLKALTLAGVPSADQRYRQLRPPAQLLSEQLPICVELLNPAALESLTRMGYQIVPRTRNDWVRFVLEDRSLSMPIQSPVERVWYSDPLSDSEVLRLGMSLPATSWNRGGLSRSVARRASAGLVPDAIRLRTSRGAQAADSWAWRLANRKRNESVLENVMASPTAAQYLDLARLKGAFDEGFEPGNGGAAWDNTVGRALNFGQFGVWWEGRLARAAVLP